MYESDYEFARRMEKLARRIKVWTAILALCVLAAGDIQTFLHQVVLLLRDGP